MVRRIDQAVRVEGLNELITRMSKLPKIARPELRKGMRKAGQIVGREAKRLINSATPTGRLYAVEKKGRLITQKASAPGEPPAKITGDVVRSIKVNASRSGLSVRIASADPKAHILEYGSVKAAPRPFLRPALANKAKEVLRAIEDGYTAALKKVLRKG